MNEKKYEFREQKVSVYFDGNFTMLAEIVDKESAVLITDDNIYSHHSEKFDGWKTIVLKAGEKYKNQKTVDEIINRLIELHADRQTFIVGVGGGVVTDITGYAASVYMRGVHFGFMPTSILAMVDASIGGKNGVDVGVYKNLVGTINHPQFLLYDYSFLETLPEKEWINGFAEIIKHACIKDKDMFDFLKENTLGYFRDSKQNIGSLIQKNVEIKYNIVANDERETGDRKLLNFGHTLGHAIENTAGLPHGSAISIGMIAACHISEKINRFPTLAGKEIEQLLSLYHLPVSYPVDKEKTWQVLLHDKKKSGKDMHFIVLNEIGNASVKKIPLSELKEIFFNLS
jgi:3-dehydroquinate synthase